MITFSMKSPVFCLFFPDAVIKCFDKKNLWEEGFSFAQGARYSRETRATGARSSYLRAESNEACCSLVLFLYLIQPRTPSPGNGSAYFSDRSFHTNEWNQANPPTSISRGPSPRTLFYSLSNWQLTLTITSLYRRLPPNPASPIPTTLPLLFL